jgi:hypothetical protein
MHFNIFNNDANILINDNLNFVCKHKVSNCNSIDRMPQILRRVFKSEVSRTTWFEKNQCYNKKFWKELICLLSLHYLKMPFALKPAFAPT